MPSWSEIMEMLVTEKGINSVSVVTNLLKTSLKKISTLQDGRHVIFYASAFLQKPYSNPTSVSIMRKISMGFSKYIWIGL